MCLGPFKQICHWGPLTALGIIKLVTAMGIHCYRIVWSKNTVFGYINYYVFITLSGLTLYNFLSSIYHGPGYLPLKWKPDQEEHCQYLQTCGVCQGYKAPRSHHCRKCGRCVLKMDHHCPWINSCVGWGNHAHFTYFLLFATLGCAHGSFIIGYALYRSIHRLYYMYVESTNEQQVFLGLHGMIMSIFALGFSIGVVIAVGILLYFQVRGIIRNRTAIEDWILEKANYRWRNSEQQFVYPYDVGLRKNVCQVLNLTCELVGDGIYWPVREGCDQFTLTREQIEQKYEKRLKAKLYTVVRPASGSWCPITHGLRVLLYFPCTDEPRIKLNIGDNVTVTRWRKQWLFGEKIQNDIPGGTESILRARGWFPRRCAVEVVESRKNKSNCNDTTSKKKK